jgi:hypothetical protein
VPDTDGKMRFWRNTSVATLAPGAVATLPDQTVGYEWDSDIDNGFRPAGLFRMSTTTVTNAPVLQDYGSTYASGTATHYLTLYRHASGALVFGAGTVQWSWGLDANHDRGSNAADPRMQQATVNLLADMGIQPATLQAGLVAATASADTTAPTSTITSPTAGASVATNSPVTITGTASDVGGGVVGGVEVSVDGGTSWHPATGRASWSYVWRTGGGATVTIKSRAVDDSGNLETPGPGVTVTVGSGNPTCPCSVWSDATTPTVPAAPGDASPVELGVKFRANVAGFVTAIRFYKGTSNVGPHVAHLWTATGSLLATASFTSETPSGWQQVPLPTAVAIAANTTYVASYHTASGHYADDQNYFTTSVTTGQLTFLADGTDGPNGVFVYGGGGFPSSGFNASNYWVDVVFSTTTPPDTTPPAVTTVSPAQGATSVDPATVVTATFTKAMDPTTINSGTFLLLDGSNNPVSASVSYSSATFTATLAPASSLSTLAAYTAVIKGGATDPRVKDMAGNAMSANFTWSFTTAGSSPSQGPGGPILVITSPSNPFSTYYAEILRAEGLNLFDVTPIGSVSSGTLAAHDVVILGEMPLTSSQVTMLTNWVSGGGQLIAMRPDKQLAGMLGLTDATSTLSNGYLLIDTSTSPAAGLVGETIQFHGTADLYSLSGATSVATLYSTATAATTRPAVTLRSVGLGHAAAFTYDLARSVVYTRQGNPAWSGQERDGNPPIRPNDLFFGAAPSDPEPDWIDLSKVAIPQADEQQRLLANLILTMNQATRPLPRFWYLPRGLEAVVVMTGDDHGNGGTSGRFDQFIASSPSGCVVDNWECIRATAYVYPSVPLTDAQAVAYTAQGFEIALHVTTNCADWTPATLEGFFASQLSQWAAQFPSLTAPVTNRTHCIVWSDYDTQPQVERNHGIRFDTNYYYWPPSWVNDRPGFFTGSGMPMRFTLATGTMVDVYQATTQMTDESGQTYPFTIDSLLDKAIGPEGYYGVFTINAHDDLATSSAANAVLASANARGIPLVSSRQMLTWLDGRNGSSFGSVALTGSTLSFSIAVGAGTTGLQVMVPVSQGQTVASITRNGQPVAYAMAVIKGLLYAFAPAAAGTYQVTFAADTTPPTVTSVTPASNATGVSVSSAVTAMFSKPMDPQTINGTTFELRDPSSSLVPATVSYNAAGQTATLAPTTSLSPSTAYTATVKGGATDPRVKDLAGNALAQNVTWSFTTHAFVCPCSIWSNAAAPANLDSGDASAVELGVKFRSDVAGSITAIRFYKGPNDTGAHVVNLWTNTGSLLTSVAVTGGTASGWQQVPLPTPVTIAANTTYVASYHTTVGRYPFDGQYFATNGVDSGPLHAPSSGAAGGNGVYAYGTGGFPTNTFNATNYWVDVVLQP